MQLEADDALGGEVGDLEPDGGVHVPARGARPQHLGVPGYRLLLIMLRAVRYPSSSVGHPLEMPIALSTTFLGAREQVEVVAVLKTSRIRSIVGSIMKRDIT